MKLSIPINLSRRLCDIAWKRAMHQALGNNAPSENDCLALLLRVWLFFCENKTGRMQDNEENRDILAGALCLSDHEIAKLHIQEMIKASVIHAANDLLVLHEYEQLQRDNASKGAHARAAAISVAAAKKNALQLLDYNEGKGVSSVHSRDTLKRAYLILNAINTALGRKQMSAGEYTDALVADVIHHIPTTITDDEVKRVCAWIRAHATIDRRCKQSLAVIITEHWRSIYQASLNDEGPLA